MREHAASDFDPEIVAVFLSMMTGDGARAAAGVPAVT
jgi:hypothetical protein